MVATTLVPSEGLLPDVLPTERLNDRGMARPPLRADLRRIANGTNVLTVAHALTLSFGVVAVAGWLHTWWAYLAAFVLMGAGHARLNILGHEAAHRLLFTNRRANDWTGRWLLGYPSFQAFLAYRRAHFAHHRDELGPNEPDHAFYRGYPIARDSWRRKMRRDALGVSGYKNLRGLAQAAVKRSTEAWSIIGVQIVLIAASIVLDRPLMYVVWIGSWMTLWRVSNRIRSIAEHGGMVQSTDRRLTTHVVRQSVVTRAWLVPYNTGYHLAHHVDMGVPWRNLPRLHAELLDAGWITPDLEYSGYLAFIRAATNRRANEL